MLPNARKRNPFLTLPNVLTSIRIVLVPLLIIFFYLPIKHAHLIACIIFISACLTDWLDGYLARYLQQTSKLGAFLDPVADKLIVSVALVMIVAEPIFQVIEFGSHAWFLPAAMISIPAAVIVARELIVSALREYMAELGKRTSVAVSSLGKFKTTVQMFALIVLLYCTKTTHPAVILLGYFLLYMAAILTIWSMVYYLKAAWVPLIEND